MSDFAGEILPPLIGLETGLASVLPDYLRDSLDHRLQTQFEFADTPHDLAIWNNVVRNARTEDFARTPQPETLRDVSSEALIEFAGKVVTTEPAERYDLTLQTAPNGQLWYDVLYGFHSDAGDEAIASALSTFRNLAADRQLQTAVDIACGTAKTTSIFNGQAENIIGIDKNAAMLRQAKQRLPTAHFAQASVDLLPFADASVDVMTSAGIKYSLQRDAAIRMYQEIGRVLKVGGVYLDTDYKDPEDIAVEQGNTEFADYHPEDLASFVTWKALLQDMIVDTVSGKHIVSRPLDVAGFIWERNLADIHLQEQRISAPSWTSSVRMLTKVS